MASFSNVTRRFFAFHEIMFAGALWLVLSVWLALAARWDAYGMVQLALGFLFWSLTEYPTHRWLLHAPKPPTPFLQRLHRRLHWGHHRDPRIEGLIFIPLFVTVPMSAIIYLAASAITQSFLRGGQFFLGFWTGLMVYEWVHFAIHAPYVTPNRMWRWLVRTHLWHHFKNERYWFGVTHPFLDYLTGTFPAVDKVEKSKTVRTLGYADPRMDEPAGPEAGAHT